MIPIRILTVAIWHQWIVLAGPRANREICEKPIGGKGKRDEGDVSGGEYPRRSSSRYGEEEADELVASRRYWSSIHRNVASLHLLLRSTWVCSAYLSRIFLVDIANR